MPDFCYKAHDKRSGREVDGSIQATDLVEAIARLKSQGLLPIAIKGARQAPAKAAAGPWQATQGPLFGGSRVKAAQVTHFTRQLSILQDAGLPIVQSLQILSDMQRPGMFKGILSTVTMDVQGGTQLSDAMARHPRVWDRLYTNLVKAGEAAGALDTILRRLAEFQEKAQKLRRRVVGALVYPTAVMSIAIIILTFIMAFIVPRFEQIFRDLNVDLPGLTVVLMASSRFVADWWMVALLLPVAAFFGIQMYRRSPSGGDAIDRLALRVPVFGAVARNSAVARFARTLGTLVGSGVGFLEALEITRAATPNVVVRNAIRDVRDSVKEGETVNEPLRRSGVFDDLVVNMVKVGEETGELDRMLLKIADNYDEEVDASVAAMMALLEPALIIFMGCSVGFIVIALFLPLIKLIDDLGKNT